MGPQSSYTLYHLYNSLVVVLRTRSLKVPQLRMLSYGSIVLLLARICNNSEAFCHTAYICNSSPWVCAVYYIRKALQNRCLSPSGSVTSSEMIVDVYTLLREITTNRLEAVARHLYLYIGRYFHKRECTSWMYKVRNKSVHHTMSYWGSSITLPLQSGCYCVTIQ